jgi:hypothetical protein
MLCLFYEPEQLYNFLRPAYVRRQMVILYIYGTASNNTVSLVMYCITLFVAVSKTHFALIHHPSPFYILSEVVHLLFLTVCLNTLFIAFGHRLKVCSSLFRHVTEHTPSQFLTVSRIGSIFLEVHYHCILSPTSVSRNVNFHF